MKRHILGLTIMACVAGLPAGAFAQGEGNSPPFPENGTIFFTANGNYARKTLSASELGMLMSAGAKPVAAGMLLTMHDGKFYMVEDHKMPSGKMLSEELGLRAAAGR